MSIATEITRLQNAKAALKTAINAKGRSITNETLDQYAAEVDSIVTGGGGTTTGDFLVRFIDYDGTVLKEEWVDSGNDATPPTVPNHSGDCSGGGLTFQGWNNPYTNVTHDIDVGSIYEATDGKTHLFLTLSIMSTKDVRLYLSKSDGSTLTVDWGDGNQSTFTNSGNFNTGTHAYASYGNYEITMWISIGTGTYGFGNGTNTTTILYAVGTVELSLTKILIGDSVPSIKTYAFGTHRSLSKISIPNTVSSMEDYCFINCTSLISVSIPNTVTILTAIFSSCYSLVTVCIPNTISDITGSVFYRCYSLESVVLDGTFTSIYTNSFVYCHALKKIFISNSVTVIGAACFRYCYKLSEFNIPSNLATINGTLVFGDCSSLVKIVFSSSLTTIGAQSFENCYSIIEYDFTSHSSVPTLSNVSAFTNINRICVIKVPAALAVAWRAATNWATYANYIVGV